MEHKCKTRLASDVNRSKYQSQMHILYSEVVSLFYGPGYGKRLGKIFYFTQDGSDNKISFIATSKTDKGKPGARC